MTQREFEAQLRYMRNPPPMRMAAALAAENPLWEILIRITGRPEALTPAEQQFSAAHRYLGDTLNGGLHQTLSNDTGALTEVVHQFAQSYCDPSLAQLFTELKALFPGGVIPLDRAQRITAIEALSGDDEDADDPDESDEPDDADPFEALTRRFWKLQAAFEQGLLRLATERGAEFRGLQ